MLLIFIYPVATVVNIDVNVNIIFNVIDKLGQSLSDIDSCDSDILDVTVENNNPRNVTFFNIFL